MRNTNQVSVVAVTPALTNAANTFTTLTRADYTLFVCASVVLDTTAKQVNFSTSTNSWKGVPPPQRRNRVEWKGAKRRSTYVPFTLRRSNLTAGVPGSTFFIGLNPDVREIFHDPFLFFHF